MKFNGKISNITARERAREYLKFSGTFRRGIYSLSEAVTRDVEEAYVNISKLLNCSREEIFFVHSPNMLNESVRLGPFDKMPTESHDFIDISTIFHRKTKFTKAYFSGSYLGCYLDVVCMDERILSKLDPLELGGDMVKRVKRDGVQFDELPYRFSAGTPDIAGILSLGAAAKSYRISEDIDKCSDDFASFLKSKKIVFKYFLSSNCFSIYDKKSINRINEFTGQKASKSLNIYVPKDRPEEIWELREAL